MAAPTLPTGWKARAGLLLAGMLVLSLLVAALAPLKRASREELFEIPKGTWARRMAGDKVDILPQTVRLTLGYNDVLLLRNRDDVPQIFGPVLIMPGQDFRMTFDVAAENQFDCTAHSSGQMTVLVMPMPDPGWPRLKWRVANLIHRFS
jgi:hypothetical protein